jgi:signal transduction histidine kinase
VDEKLIVKITEIIDQVFSGNSCDATVFADVPVSQVPEVNALAEKITTLSKQYIDARNFIIELSRGRLDSYPPRHNRFADPYKQLHSELSHLTWQITQIADGDYDQKVSFLGDFSGSMNKMIIALRERKELADKVAENEKQLREYSEELKRSNATKDKLFSIIAHDLRNPFNALINLSEMLVPEIEDGNKDVAVECANMMHDSAMQGYQLLLNLLDWARQQGGKIVYKPRLFNIKNVINSNISVVALSASSKGVTIEFIADGELPLSSDESIFSTIFRNLLSNAVKYTPEGGRVVVEVIKAAEFYHISVKDSGVGIPADKLELLFDDGSVTSTPGTNSEAGTGLGLMLCSDFVRMLGGKIWVESVESEGSTFTFSVPEQVSI